MILKISKLFAEIEFFIYNIIGLQIKNRLKQWCQGENLKTDIGPNIFTAQGEIFLRYENTNQAKQMSLVFELSFAVNLLNRHPLTFKRKWRKHTLSYELLLYDVCFKS